MRPLKDLFFEEYWEIGYRKYTEDDSVVNGKDQCSFDVLCSDKRFWYADPFLFEKDGKTFLFVEMFDNSTETGVIGYSEFVNDKFTKPKVILKEKFHISYPYVFEKDNEIYMMPESHEADCIQLYRAVSFPDKWEKSQLLIDNINTADTILENDMLITSVICPENDMSIDLCVYDKDLQPCEYNPVYSHSYIKRGAGKCFNHKNKRVRPAQSCENQRYGCKLYFNELEQCDRSAYREKPFSEITPKNISTTSSKNITGIHTYARTDKIEVVDIKSYRLNLYRLFYILKRKIFR